MDNQTKKDSRLAVLFRLFRKDFLAGIFVAVPLIVIFWVLGWFIGFLESIFALVPREWLPQSFLAPGLSSLVNFILLMGVAIALILLISLLGFFSKLYLGRKALKIFGHLIKRIPIIGSVYTTMDQLMGALNQGEGNQFHRVVLLEYPRRGVWAVGFVTGAFTSRVLPPGYLNVFVPTVPNPTAGFHLIVPETDVKETAMKVDEAFRLIISLGIAQIPETEAHE